MSTFVWIIIIALGIWIILRVTRKKKGINFSPETYFANERKKFDLYLTEKRKLSRLLHEFCQENISIPFDSKTNLLIMDMSIDLFRMCFLIVGYGEYIKYFDRNTSFVQETCALFSEDVRSKVQEQKFLNVLIL